MGWCSATDIMDAALEAAEKLAEEAFNLGQQAQGSTRTWADCLKDNPELREHLDNVLRPYVRTIARKLHDGDWDCVDEAAAFDRFPQEMYDHDDREHEAWIRDHLADATRYDEPDQVIRWSQMLKAHTDKMKAGNG